MNEAVRNPVAPLGACRAALVLLASVFAAHFLDRQLLAILIPPIKPKMGLSDTALGFLSGFAFTVFFSTAELIIARLADRVGRACITWSLAASRTNAQTAMPLLDA